MQLPSQPESLVPMHFVQLYPMSIPPLLISLERFVLQMLGWKLKRITIVKIGTALAFLSHPRLEPNISLLQGNNPSPTGKSFPAAAPRLILHLVKQSHPNDIRLNDSIACRSSLKNLVRCYHWLEFQEVRESIFGWCRRRRTIMLAPNCNNNSAMGLITEANNLNQYGDNMVWCSYNVCS